MTTHVTIRTAFFAIDPQRTRCRRGPGPRAARTGVGSERTARSVPAPEDVEEPEHDGQQPERADPADRRGVAAVLVADLEGRVPHVDGPRVRRPVAVEPAQQDVLVD